jgi:catechol O-methyltransferase
VESQVESDFTAIAKEMAEISGLTEMITFVVGPAETSLRQLKEQNKIHRADILFWIAKKSLLTSEFAN